MCGRRYARLGQTSWTTAACPRTLCLLDHLPLRPLPALLHQHGKIGSRDKAPPNWRQPDLSYTAGSGRTRITTGQPSQLYLQSDFQPHLPPKAPHTHFGPHAEGNGGALPALNDLLCHTAPGYLSLPPDCSLRMNVYADDRCPVVPQARGDCSLGQRSAHCLS